jgi:hypothetical protein
MDVTVTAGAWRYRYYLERLWLTGEGRACWVMLNPSTADDTVDDPTIRRVIGFTQAAGFAGFSVVNLFALRSTSPRGLIDTAVDPVGPENAITIKRAVTTASAVVFAWGATILPQRLARIAATQAAFVKHCCATECIVPLCLGQTADRSPRHPLYVAGEQPLIPFEVSP